MFCARRANCSLKLGLLRRSGGAVTAVSPPTEAPRTRCSSGFVGQAPGVVVRQTPGTGV